MQKVKEWLKPFSDYFLNGFSDTFQLLLDNFLGDYLEDPKQLNMGTLLKGVEMLKLNKTFINQLLGQSLFTLEEAYIKSIKVANLKFEASGVKLVFALVKEINIDELKEYLDKTEEAKQKEILKLNQLAQLREEVYKHSEFEQSVDLTKSMGPQTGLIQFLGLVDTLLSNSSITIKNIEIILIAEGGKQYEFHIHHTNINFQKQNLNNLLFISFGIDQIELQLEKEQIALIENALKFEMVVETKNGRVNTKVDGKISSLDIVLNTKQIKNLLSTAQKCLSLTDELNKIMMDLKGETLVEFDDDQEFQQKLEKTEFSFINSQNTVTTNKKNVQPKLVPNFSYMDTLNNNLQQSLAQHPIPQQKEKQFIEFSQSIFNTSQEQLDFGSRSVKNQAETFKCQFDGIRIAVSENSQTFPKLKGRFFQDLESHFFIEIIKIQGSYHKDNIKFQIQSIGAHRVRADSNNAINIVQSQEIFRSCLENPRYQFYVTPVIMMGLGEQGRVEQDFAIYIFDKLQEECKPCKALEMSIQIFNGKNREKFYMANMQVSDFIGSLNHELCLNLMQYLPQSEVQKLPDQEIKKPCMFGFDIKLPYVNLNYFINNKPISLRAKDIKLKQTPVKKFSHKLGAIEAYEGIPKNENPLQFLCISFFSIWIEFSGQNIVTIGQNVVDDLQIYPLIYISFQEKKDVKKNGKSDLRGAVQYRQERSETLIRGSLPLVDVRITQELLYWLISLNQYFEKQQNLTNKKKPQRQLKEESLTYIQLNIESSSLNMLDHLNKDLLQIDLEKTTLISSKQTIILVQNILVIDNQCPLVKFNRNILQQTIKKYSATQIMLYRTHSNQFSSQIIFAGQKRLYQKPIEVDYDNYIFKLQLGKMMRISIQNICLRIPDFQFTSFKKLNHILQNFKQNTQKQQQHQAQQEKEMEIEIRVHNNLFLDIFPINEVEELSNQGLQTIKEFSNSRALIHIEELVYNKSSTLQQARLYVGRQNGLEFQCPLILENYFEKLNAFQFTSVLTIEQLKFINNTIRVDLIKGNFRFDIIQTILEINEELQPYIPQTVPQDPTKKEYFIQGDFSKPLIEGEQLDNKIEIIIGKLLIHLEEGHTFYQMPLYMENTNSKHKTFGEELQEYVEQSDKIQNKTLDTVSLCFTNVNLQTELYSKGQTGIKFQSHFEIEDNIKDSKFKLLLSPDTETFCSEDKSFPIEIGLILENQAYTASVKISPMRICISGAFLQFVFNFQNSQSWIQKQIYEDQIQIFNSVQKSPQIWLKGLQIIDTCFNLSYDSKGLQMDDLLKGLLRISSFYDLQIPIKYMNSQIRGSPEEVINCVLTQFQQSLGSKLMIAGKALTTLEVFSTVTNLVKGTLNLLLKPLEEGFLKGTKKGVQEFSNSLIIALLNTLKVPSSVIITGGETVGLQSLTLPFRFVNERSNQLLDKISPSMIPKRFFKRQ
ncbi:unnamed protein product (macronuclear) [Paramecium tetraurelia]|uniref:Chorein N-terminal domain-containing protein n=1 Tax=Paramecium tetraurelia TaxID=5888 RepID=A0DBM5_PARTE|nr:uncharacterized protein GSPATT00015338001 [Paramecium tetraurelia]CAK80442.1 unnamed protein product [Paramecium tetraurelia]|eukprot:XP_001447839.1 hypothetical protein (macronuclear) [Paramecium tetraurelia strain d4-2]